MAIPEPVLDSLFSLAYSPTENHNRPATTRARRSVTTVSPEVVSYDTVVNMKFKVKGGSADYLQVTSGSSNVILAPQDEHSAAACFRVHRFDVLNPYPEGGQVVVFESHDGNRFIQGASSGDLVITDGSSRRLQEVTQTDNRFFLLYSDQGDNHLKIKHLHAGLFLSATHSRVSLVSHTGVFSDPMFFEGFQCTH
ncbi:uncharacterized protein LOC121876930 [Homarus americanus]|uniref:uncharacterized protein LOC121876930 n=1 Tax=Homarus americanus TaxID=6706 RepID=UPI001C44CE59|nr:uncharacterized protein LOC121876930 [Homarus americanus]XP_042238433.1 uncharacterized protein LOC121876930 [Homarus americanus]XP_042238435.1 uncharacterized protein LOC121876930 [Homarus americanus]